MKVIVVDDDPIVRGVVGVLVAERGLSLVGEAEDQQAGLELLKLTQPDIAVVDLALRYSTGREVLRAAWDQGCRVIIFSAFLTPDLLGTLPGGPMAVEKPHFDRLETALEQMANSVTAQGHDRRARDRQEPTVGTFAEGVALASPGDAIVILEPRPFDKARLDVVGLTASRVTSAADRVETTSRQVRMLLVVAGRAGSQAVIDRVQARAGVDLSRWLVRVEIVTAEVDGVEAFLRAQQLEPG